MDSASAGSPWASRAHLDRALSQKALSQKSSGHILASASESLMQGKLEEKLFQFIFSLTDRTGIRQSKIQRKLLPICFQIFDFLQLLQLSIATGGWSGILDWVPSTSVRTSGIFKTALFWLAHVMTCAMFLLSAYVQYTFTIRKPKVGALRVLRQLVRFLVMAGSVKHIYYHFKTKKLASLDDAFLLNAKNDEDDATAAFPHSNLLRKNTTIKPHKQTEAPEEEAKTELASTERDNSFSGIQANDGVPRSIASLIISTEFKQPESLELTSCTSDHDQSLFGTQDPQTSSRPIGLVPMGSPAQEYKENGSHDASSTLLLQDLNWKASAKVSLKCVPNPGSSHPSPALESTLAGAHPQGLKATVSNPRNSGGLSESSIHRARFALQRMKEKRKGRQGLNSKPRDKPESESEPGHDPELDASPESGSESAGRRAIELARSRGKPPLGVSGGHRYSVTPETSPNKRGSLVGKLHGGDFGGHRDSGTLRVMCHYRSLCFPCLKPLSIA